MPLFIRWTYCISPFAHAFALLSDATLRDQEIPCSETADPQMLTLQDSIIAQQEAGASTSLGLGDAVAGTQISCPLEGNSILSLLGIDHDLIGVHWAILIGIAVIYLSFLLPLTVYSRLANVPTTRLVTLNGKKYSVLQVRFWRTSFIQLLVVLGLAFGGIYGWPWPGDGDPRTMPFQWATVAS
eukprot:1386365-Prymnesium_polylepis.1